MIKDLLQFVKPLRFQMFIAILCGTIGHLLAISIPVLGIFGVLTALGFFSFNLIYIFYALAFCSGFRGVFAYIEQNRNHYIAFTILAQIRDKIFTALRKLCPAKLDGKNRGNLISIITSDIELLEVFYAHTVSPVVIACIITVVIGSIMWLFDPVFAIISITAHITVGCILPILTSKNNSKIYTNYREQNGKLSSFYLDSLRGLDEILQMQNGQKRIEEIQKQTKKLEVEQEKIALHEGKTNAVADALVLFFGGLMLAVSSFTQENLTHIALPTVIMMSSFGPVLALSKLSVGLSRTLACAKRVQELINEVPEVFDVENGKNPKYSDLKIEDLSFSYSDKQVLKNINLQFLDGKITSIIGQSGSGKSTLIKLIMRFWNSKGIKISDEKLEEIDTKALRNMQSYMTQDSDIFSFSIKENILIGKISASEQEMIEASKKASLHDFVMSLQNGYDTKVGELGDTLSGGEKQRIGLARAFLHNGDLLILDEPTSNLDSLNEGIILKSIKEHSKTTILISHRRSTLGVSDKSFEIKDGMLGVSI